MKARLSKIRPVLLSPLAILVLAAGCGRSEPTPPPDVAATTAETSPPVAAPEPTATATAGLSGASGSKAAGELNFAAGNGGVSVTGHVAGLSANTVHGFHVHQNGDCSARDAKSAGDHFNPEMTMHGGPTAENRHLGDMPNIESDGTGNATVSATLSGATLRDGGPHDLLGKAVIVHARRDDYMSQPSGDSGDRIACGVIR